MHVSLDRTQSAERPRDHDTSIEPRREPHGEADAGPRGDYGAPSRSPTAERRASPATQLEVRTKGGDEVARLRRRLCEINRGEDPELPDADLKTLQAAALELAQRTFTNRYRDDGELKTRIA